MPALDPAHFRQVLGRFATGVTVITTRGSLGKPVGITINSFTSLSLKPPLVLFCLGNKSKTLRAFKSADIFAVNILGAKQEDISRHFSGSRAGGWTNVKWSWGDHGCPVLDGVIGSLVCKKTQVIKGGDHQIIIGKVTELKACEASAPLLYYRSGYHKLKD